MAVGATTNEGPGDGSPAFEFVRAIAGELSGGTVDLPSFPDIVIRVRRVLADDASTVDQVVRVIGSEPAMAARLLTMANSAALNPSGKQLTDLRTAVNRMGYDMVRIAAIAFAMAQVRGGVKLASLQKQLEALWQHSTHVAALAFMLADKCAKINPDEAMLTGLLHGIGKLYILTRAEQHPQLFAESESLNQVLADWHASLGKAILENWGFAEVMSEAIANQDDVLRESRGAADLSDVIAVAILMADFAEDFVGLEAAAQKLAPVKRLGLDPKRSMQIMRDSATQVAALRQALGS